MTEKPNITTTYPIWVTMPDDEIREGRYRWLDYGEKGADGTTLRVVEWTGEWMPSMTSRNDHLREVRAIHSKRLATNDYMAPYTYEYCVEDRQVWPCKTIEAIGDD